MVFRFSLSSCPGHELRMMEAYCPARPWLWIQIDLTMDPFLPVVTLSRCGVVLLGSAAVEKFALTHPLVDFIHLDNHGV